MKTIMFDTDFKEAAAQLQGHFPAPSHATETVRENTEIRASDGRVKAVYLHNVIPTELHEHEFELCWSAVNGLISNRATASGTKSLPRSVNKRGDVSLRSGVNEEVLGVIKGRQAILGYSGKPVQQTTFTLEHPEILEKSKQLGRLVN